MARQEDQCSHTLFLIKGTQFVNRLMAVRDLEIRPNNIFLTFLSAALKN